MRFANASLYFFHVLWKICFFALSLLLFSRYAALEKHKINLDKLKFVLVPFELSMSRCSLTSVRANLVYLEKDAENRSRDGQSLPAAQKLKMQQLRQEEIKLKVNIDERVAYWKERGIEVGEEEKVVAIAVSKAAKRLLGYTT